MVLELGIICPRGQVRGDPNNSASRSARGKSRGSWYGGEEWVAEVKGGVDSCDVVELRGGKHSLGVGHSGF